MNPDFLSDFVAPSTIDRRPAPQPRGGHSDDDRVVSSSLAVRASSPRHEEPSSPTQPTLPHVTGLLHLSPLPDLEQEGEIRSQKRYKTSIAPVELTSWAPLSHPKEVDFYRNPTVLSRLVLTQRYLAAMDRLRRIPHEATIWVCVRRKRQTAVAAAASSRKGVDSKYSLRQLPIHIACSNLRRTYDSRLRAQLNDLICSLIVVNPDGSHQRDHQGKMALHTAITSGANPETISLFLMAHPKSIDSCDSMGRTLVELNTYKSEERRAHIREILDRGHLFYEVARSEAHLRLKLQSPVLPSSAESISSTHVLASSQIETESVVSDKGEETVQTTSAEEVASTAWEQVEQRAMAMEQILTEVNEENFALNLRIDQMLQHRADLLEQLGRFQDSRLSQELNDMQRQNLELRQRLEGVLVLLEHAFPDEESFGGMSSIASVAERINVDITTIMEKYARLRQRHLDQTQKIRSLKSSLSRGSSRQESSGTSLSEPSSDYESESRLHSDQSTLSSSIRSPKRAERNWKLEASMSSAVDLVDWIPPTPGDADAKLGKKDLAGPQPRRASHGLLKSPDIFPLMQEEQPSPRILRRPSEGLLAPDSDPTPQATNIRTVVAAFLPSVPSLDEPVSVVGPMPPAKAPSMAEITWDPDEGGRVDLLEDFETLTAVLRQTAGGSDFDHLSTIFRTAAAARMTGDIQDMRSPPNVPRALVEDVKIVNSNYLLEEIEIPALWKEI